MSAHATDYFALAAQGATEARDAVCLVSKADYERHWNGAGTLDEEAPVWSGEERRSGVVTRRTQQHERRWEGGRGRRFGYADRRRSA